MQNAADAAATAGVTYLPDDFASAKATAITVAGRNGYPNSGTSSVAVSIGDKPTQLVVTISSTIRNAFGTSFGVGTETIVRGATADFNGPVPDGQPVQRLRQRATRHGSDRPAWPRVTGEPDRRPAGRCPVHQQPAVLGRDRGSRHAQEQR